MDLRPWQAIIWCACDTAAIASDCAT
jgi:hypothetical protein